MDLTYIGCNKKLSITGNLNWESKLHTVVLVQLVEFFDMGTEGLCS